MEKYQRFSVCFSKAALTSFPTCHIRRLRLDKDSIERQDYEMKTNCGCATSVTFICFEGKLMKTKIEHSFSSVSTKLASLILEFNSILSTLLYELAIGKV